MSILCDEEPARIVRAEIPCHQIYTIGFLDRAEAAGCNPETSHWRHAGETIYRKGVVTLARCNKQAAIGSFGRLDLAVIEELRAAAHLSTIHRQGIAQDNVQRAGHGIRLAAG